MEYIEIENTHNYCTREKCLYNTIESEKTNNNETKNNTKNFCTANFCISCGVNMGDSNPRQYCYKTYCPFEEHKNN